MKHHGKVALVTGGSNGIGQAIALRLAAEGARVANLDIAPGDESEARAQAAGHTLQTFACDLAQLDQITAAVAAVKARWGAPTVLVHAAAYLSLQPIETLTPAEWRLTQTVNVDAAFHLSQALLPGMRAAQWGRIVLITSSTFWVGGSSMTHYVTSKGALVGLAHGLSAEVGADGITVNCVAPGLTRTAKVAGDHSEAFFREVAAVQSIKRNGTPEDQAAAVSFLASDEAGFISGQTFLVDGGQART